MTAEEFFSARGIDPRSVKFGRLVPQPADPFQVTVSEFRQAAEVARALDWADCWFMGLQRHCGRLRVPLMEDASLGDVLAHISDIEVALVLLVRLRRAANLLANKLEGFEALRTAIRAFDLVLPDLEFLRNTQEHFDDYIIGEGHQVPKVGTRRSYLTGDGAPTICRGRRKIDLEAAIKAARTLYIETYRVTTGGVPPLLDEAADTDSPRHGARTEISFSSPYYYWDETENGPVAGEDLPAANE